MTIEELAASLERLATAVETLGLKLDAAMTDVRSTLMIHHEVRNLRDRVAALESRPPPNGMAAE